MVSQSFQLYHHVSVAAGIYAACLTVSLGALVWHAKQEGDSRQKQYGGNKDSSLHVPLLGADTDDEFKDEPYYCLCVI